MKYSKQPKPSKILNIAASQSGMAVSLGFTPIIPGTLPYVFDAPKIQGDQVLFVEHGICFMHPLKRSLILCVSIALIVPGVIVSLFVIDEGIDLDGFVFILGMMALCGIAVALPTLWIAWVTRTLCLWPVVFDSHNDDIRVSLAHRGAWCTLKLLSPSLNTGEITWSKIKHGEPIPNTKLPDCLHNHTHACWLELNYESRKRWVLLSLHEGDAEASTSLLDWAQKFKLSEDVFESIEPPSQVIYYLERRLW